jgi:hypothetical protein
MDHEAAAMAATENVRAHFGLSVEYVSNVIQFVAQARSIIRSWEVRRAKRGLFHHRFSEALAVLVMSR